MFHHILSDTRSTKTLVSLLKENKMALGTIRLQQKSLLDAREMGEAC